ncbi:ribonuclease activity regulator RraA [Saccharopolyspora sp. 5N708]|uniref:RraA family protein n=1 Tax=Saccharopolyspora sp. 5N708 TaxID=3457424 RepID=UPI003FD375C7
MRPRANEPVDVRLPIPDIARELPLSGPPFSRPDPDLINRLQVVSSATASAVMHRMGVRQTYIQGPIPRQPGTKVVGPVVTLQFMPKREDVVSGVGAGAQEEHVEKKSALWDVFESVQPGDVLAVSAYGDVNTGCMGEMLVTYFQGRGGAGIVVDGCVRDWPRIKEIGTPLWTCGFTPNFASQTTLFPWASNVPIACNRVLVLPGDIIIADDDGAVLVPAQMAEMVLEHTVDHEEWEEFSRLKLAEGGALKKYYPLSEQGWAEYEAWRAAQADEHPRSRS